MQTRQNPPIWGMRQGDANCHGRRLRWWMCERGAACGSRGMTHLARGQVQRCSLIIGGGVGVYLVVDEAFNMH